MGPHSDWTGRTGLTVNGLRWTQSVHNWTEVGLQNKGVAAWRRRASVPHPAADGGNNGEGGGD